MAPIQGELFPPTRGSRAHNSHESLSRAGGFWTREPRVCRKSANSLRQIGAICAELSDRRCLTVIFEALGSTRWPRTDDTDTRRTFRAFSASAPLGMNNSGRLMFAIGSQARGVPTPRQRTTRKAGVRAWEPGTHRSYTLNKKQMNTDVRARRRGTRSHYAPRTNNVRKRSSTLRSRARVVPTPLE